MTTKAINIVFDGPPGPEAGRFVEVETDDGESIKIGEWGERPDGLWALRKMPPLVPRQIKALAPERRRRW
jgi:hypothetical protein